MTHVVRALLFKEMREGRWKYLIAAAVLVALGVSIPVMYNFVVDMLNTLMQDDAVPPALLELVSPELLELSTYLWGNWHMKNLYQAMVVIALVFGSGTIAGEFSRGTAQFLFSALCTEKASCSSKPASIWRRWQWQHCWVPPRWTSSLASPTASPYPPRFTPHSYRLWPGRPSCTDWLFLCRQKLTTL